MESGKASQLIFIGSQKALTIEKNFDYLFNQDDVEKVITELNTDDKPIIEFSAANSLYSNIRKPIKFEFNNENIYEKLNALN
jgi:hypothetical protein